MVDMLEVHDPGGVTNLALKFNLPLFVLFGALLPGIGCYFLVVYTFMFQKGEIDNLKTDSCPNVTSYLAPISYSIGVWEPQKFIWMFVMFFHIPPRAAFTMMYMRLVLNTEKYHLFNVIRRIYKLTLWLEPFGLVLGTVVDVEHFLVHGLAFAIWNASLNFNLLFYCLLKQKTSSRTTSKVSKLQFYLRWIMFASCCFVGVGSGVVYALFFNICSELCYFLFALSEHLLVGYSSIFHAILYFDLPSSIVQMSVRKRSRNQKKMAWAS